jgi:hypothetical protein
MITDGETIPQHPVGDSVKFYTVCLRNIPGMSKSTGKHIVLCMDAICIDPAFSCADKPFDSVMHSIEEPFPVKRAAFKYDRYTCHPACLSEK